MKNKNELVSVVILSYNHKDYIEEAITSVITQDYPHIELIVVDDNSSDGSKELLKKLQSKYNFKLILKNKNYGKPSHSANLGLSLAKGKYIKFLASDDFLPDNSIVSKQVLELSKLDKTYAGVMGSIYRVENGKISGIYSIAAMLPVSYCSAIGGYGITLQACMFRRECLLEINGFDNNSLIEDYDISIRLLKKYKIKKMKAFCVAYRIHSNNLSGPTNYNKMLTARKYIYNKYDDLKKYHFFKQAIKEKNILSIIKYLNLNNIKFLLCNINYLISIILMKLYLRFDDFIKKE